MIAAATTCERVAPVCMFPMAGGVDLGHQFGQVACIVYAVDLFMGPGDVWGDVCVIPLAIGRC